VKSVLGEFSSGVSICRNTGTQSDLGSPSSDSDLNPLI